MVDPVRQRRVVTDIVGLRGKLRRQRLHSRTTQGCPALGAGVAETHGARDQDMDGHREIVVARGLGQGLLLGFMQDEVGAVLCL